MAAEEPNTKEQAILESLGFASESPEQTFPDDFAQTETLSVLSTDAAAAAKEDLNFLAGIAIPHIFKYLFPSTFLNLWTWLRDWSHKVRAFPQLALGLPRGFAKTTFIKLFVLYCILFTNKRFILVISSTATLAENILSDIAGMLDQPNIKAIFGNWRIGLEKDTQELKKFGFRGRNVIIAGIGVGGSIRGFNLDHERPDVMIFEDIQTKEAANSQVQSLAIEDWMFSTAMKAKSPNGCMFLFIGNMYPSKWSILRKLKANPTWFKVIVGGILEDGTSLWEDLQPITQLLQEFENDLISGHPEIFYAEVLNDENASVNNLIDIGLLPKNPFSKNEIPGGKLIIIDPSNDKSNSDAVSIGYFEVFMEIPVLQELIEGKLSPGDTIREALKLALKHNCRVVGIESNAFQYSLLYWFNQLTLQLQISGIHAVEVYSGGLSKNTRILTMFKELQKGELFYSAATAAQVNLQISQFNALKRDNIDGVLDLLAYAKKMLALYADLIVSYSIVTSQEYDSHEVITDNSSF